jgi:hypothetical protein
VFNAMKQLIVVVYQGKVEFNTFLNTRIGEPPCNTYTIAFFAEILSNLRQVVLMNLKSSIEDKNLV